MGARPLHRSPSGSLEDPQRLDAGPDAAHTWMRLSDILRVKNIRGQAQTNLHQGQRRSQLFLGLESRGVGHKQRRPSRLIITRVPSHGLGGV